MSNADEKTDWKVVPMIFMKHFDDCSEWALMEKIWFLSNLDGYKLNLSTLNSETPIKSRGTLLKVLDRLVLKGWIRKTPFGESGKHHKYSLNREEFIKWMECQREKEVRKSDSKKSINQTSESLKIGLPNGLESRPNMVCKADCTDKGDNSLENTLEKLPDKEKLEPVVIPQDVEHKMCPYTSKTPAVAPETKKTYNSFREFMKSPEYNEVGAAYDKAYELEVTPFRFKPEYKAKLEKLYERFPQFALN